MVKTKEGDTDCSEWGFWNRLLDEQLASTPWHLRFRKILLMKAYIEYGDFLHYDDTF